MHPKIYTSSEHPIQRHLIDEDALWSVEQLKASGHTAYIVGGSIRDLLLGRTPKDFDISTSARPEEIKRIFQRRCLIIGKRFRLAHLRFGSKVIEASTFRAGDTAHDGLIVRDNLWGTEEEDVFRRDFTMNALYYDPDEEIIIDYVDGLEDISHHLIRTIGDPVVRFRQDPVRMLRLLKFQARFGFVPEEKTLEALSLVREEIRKSASARIFEELMKMLESGYALPFFDLLNQHGFLQLLLPLPADFIKNESGNLFRMLLSSIDHMISSGYKDSIDRSCLTAALLFPMVEHDIFLATQEQKNPLKMGSVFSIVESSVRSFAESSFAHFPKRILSSAFSILIHQFRLTPLKGAPKFSLRFPSQETFRQALTLLSMRACIDHNLIPLWEAWKDEYQSRPAHSDSHEESEREHGHHTTHHHGKRRPYRRKRRRPAA